MYCCLAVFIGCLFPFLLISLLSQYLTAAFQSFIFTFPTIHPPAVFLSKNVSGLTELPLSLQYAFT